VKPWSHRKWVVAGVVGTVGVVAYLVVAIFLAPKWAAADVTSSKPEAQATARATERSSVRTAMLAVLAGGIAVVGAVYTGRTFALNQRESARNQREAAQMFELTRRGQLTERFTRAVDQLGQTDKLDVRLGGIYALEQLAHESADEYVPIIEILTAYVRSHAPAKRCDDGTTDEVQPGQRVDHLLAEDAPVDIKAVMTTLARLSDNPKRTEVQLDLRKTELRGVHASGLHAGGARLEGANLRRAILDGADLQGAILVLANLQEADLERANLWWAYLGGANLQGAKLKGATLQKAHLKGVNLRKAYLGVADLQEADLERANLQSAYLGEAWLGGANLEGADLGPPWPQPARRPARTRLLAMAEASTEDSPRQHGRLRRLTPRLPSARCGCARGFESSGFCQGDRSPVRRECGA
jgi:hypothetical protein